MVCVCVLPTILDQSFVLIIIVVITSLSGTWKFFFCLVISIPAEPIFLCFCFCMCQLYSQSFKLLIRFEFIFIDCYEKTFPAVKKKKMKDDHHYTQTTTVILTLFLAKKNTPFKNESIMSFSTHPKPIQFINSKFLSMTDIVCEKEIFDATNDSGLLLLSSSFISVEAKKKFDKLFLCFFTIHHHHHYVSGIEKIFFRWHRKTKKKFEQLIWQAIKLIHSFIHLIV